MPSEASKKRAQKKKEAAKTRLGKKPTKKEDGTATPPVEEVTNGLSNGASNGACNGAAAEGATANGHTNGCNGDSAEGQQTYGSADDTADHLATQLAKFDLLATDARTCTGVLGSHRDSRDLQIGQFSLAFHGHDLLVDTKLELNTGRRYGLIGPNGCGKSTMLSAIAHRELPIPKHFDMFHLRREVEASDKTALRCVIEVDSERRELEAEAEELAHNDSAEAQERLMDVYERLDDMEADKAEMKAGRILNGLGFTHDMQYTAAKNFSGGWRMRIALARALYIQPSVLLLDEPTNHLDLEACVWLEAELGKYKRVLVIISHSQDFMNGVCTNIIHMQKQKLNYFTGNYDQYMQTRFELEENQMKQFKHEQSQIQHMKNYIARFGHGSAKLARQAQSKEKTLKKMVDQGLTEKVETDKTLQFSFYSCGQIPPPAIMVQHVSFRYNEKTEYIYKDLDFGIDMDTRVALVGPNGAGKSTLLKLICGELTPTDGMVRRNPHLKIGRYHQHLQEILDMEMSALDWFRLQFPDVKDIEVMRKILGRYGLTGKQQVCPIRNLSDGQRCRIMFGWLAQQSPHLLLLDEPTNHLDIETIDSLAEAINDFEGAMILVSHDFRLINQVSEVIWECNHQKITRWEGDIYSYKQHLVKRVKKEMKAYEATF